MLTLQKCFVHLRAVKGGAQICSQWDIVCSQRCMMQTCAVAAARRRRREWENDESPDYIVKRQTELYHNAVTARVPNAYANLERGHFTRLFAIIAYAVRCCTAVLLTVEVGCVFSTTPLGRVRSERIYLGSEVLRTDEDGRGKYGAAPGTGMKARKKWEIPEKTGGPVASSGTNPTCESPRVTPPGIEPGSPWREASSLTAKPPRHHGDFRDTIFIYQLNNLAHKPMAEAENRHKKTVTTSAT
ncbi:hypothetical protein PR048_008104 [Dryococelus australis]|uniref:Uncharacterized protein n=1 Tax=Dryococelus australis TaxID=614101 RepID=A0ABQ9HW55_9NEOP|nr:hypothetical protein PR048_008104 [Dryococelus australis]